MATKRNSQWQELQQRIETCRLCPRLIAHCREVAHAKRAAYLDEEYWGRPVPNLGTSKARLLIVGLAPGAHGANRTGRMFTGDRSGQWLYRALHRNGFANQATWERREDGLKLLDCVITSAVHCAPPGNRPEAVELANCRPFLVETLSQVTPVVIVTLGQIAWRATRRALQDQGHRLNRTDRFRHGAETTWAPDRWLLASYHPSQQNTFTGRLTEPMFDTIFSRARELKDKDKA